MKKLLLVFVFVSLVCLPLMAELKTSGVMRTRMAYWKSLGTEEDQRSNSNIDTRLRMMLANSFDDNLKAKVQLEIGDIVWGTAPAGDLGTDGVVIEVKHAYMEYMCKMLDMKAKVGLQGYADHRGLVLDDDLAAIMLHKNMNELSFAFGLAKLEEQHSWDDDDKDLLILNAEYDKMYGADVIFQRQSFDTGQKNYVDTDAWIMPYANLKMDNIHIDIMAALNYGSITARNDNDDDMTNMGYAFALKAAYEDGFKLGLDFLYTSGHDYDENDPNADTSHFNTISNYYANGLEIFSWGAVNDSRCCEFTNPTGFKDQNGNIMPTGVMNVVVTASVPANEKVTLKAALGMVNANTAPKMANGDDAATAVATEINVGTTINLYESLNFDLAFAYAMLGDFYKETGIVNGDPEDLMKIVSRLQFKF